MGIDTNFEIGPELAKSGISVFPPTQREDFSEQLLEFGPDSENRQNYNTKPAFSTLNLELDWFLEKTVSANFFDHITQPKMTTDVAFVPSGLDIKAIELDTGNLIWEGPSGWDGEVGDGISVDPEGGRVHVNGRAPGPNGETAAALDINNGNILWDRTDPDWSPSENKTRKGLVIYPMNEGPTAREKETGNLEWKQNTKTDGNDIIPSQTEENSGNVLLGWPDERFLVEIDTGNVIWSNTYPGSDTGKSSLHLSGRFYITGIQEDIIAIDDSSGAVEWRSSFGHTGSTNGFPATDGQDIFGTFIDSGSGEGFLASFTPSGSLNWEISLGQRSPSSIQYVSGGRNDVIYLPTFDGYIMMVDPGTQSITDEFKATNAIEEGLGIAGDNLIFVTRNKIRKYNIVGEKDVNVVHEQNRKIDSNADVPSAIELSPTVDSVQVGAESGPVGSDNRAVQFSLPSPGSLENITFVGDTNLSATIGSIEGFAWNDTGTELYVANGGFNNVYSFQTGTPYNVDVMSSSFNQFNDLDPNVGVPSEVAWDNDGDRFFVSDFQTIYTFTTSNFDIDNMTISKQFTFPDSIVSFDWVEGGEYLFALSQSQDILFVYSAGSDYDIDSLTLLEQIPLLDLDGGRAIKYSSSQKKLYVVDASKDTVERYHVAGV
jgi:hypothetical protein